MHYTILLGITLLIFVIFVITFLIIFKFKIKKEQEDLIEDILISNPNSSCFDKIRHLGQESFDGWIWDNRKVKELSYKELINIYNIVYFK